MLPRRRHSAYNLAIVINPKQKRRYLIKLGGVVYVAISIFIGLAALNSQTNLLFWIFGLLMGGLIVSGLLSGAMMNSLLIKRITPQPAHVDQPLTIQYQITNKRGILPCFGFTIREIKPSKQPDWAYNLPIGYVVYIPPKTSTVVNAHAFGSTRGTVELPKLEVSTSFPFGILTRSAILPLVSKITILPKLHPLSRQLFHDIKQRSTNGARSGKHAGGLEEFYGLREYQHGDELKRIDWKNSAKSGKLISREYTKPAPPKLHIVLNLHGAKNKLPHTEQAISFTASVFAHAAQLDYECSLTIVARRNTSIPPDSGKSHFNKLFHVLADLNDEDFPESDAPAPSLHDLTSLTPPSIIIHATQSKIHIGPPSLLNLDHHDFASYISHDQQSITPSAPDLTTDSAKLPQETAA